jgi:hypothetical protein
VGPRGRPPLIDLLILPPYIGVMRLRLIRHFIFVIALGAFLGAGVMQGVWPVRIDASSDMTTMAQAGDDAPMPCKGMMPACMTDLGCIFMIGLPTISPTQTMTRLAWRRVHYDSRAQSADGLTRKPALDPPIFLG